MHTAPDVKEGLVLHFCGIIEAHVATPSVHAWVTSTEVNDIITDLSSVCITTLTLVVIYQVLNSVMDFSCHK